MSAAFWSDFDTEELYAPLGVILQVEWYGRSCSKTSVSPPLALEVQLDSSHSICE